jgi:DNA uptake protein ComE-like DNA-binding protein
MTRSPLPARAFATILTLWTLGMLALVLAVTQSAAFKQSAAGREALGRVRAHWAARAGVETQIARLTAQTLTPDTSSAFALSTDLAAYADADLGDASFDIQHSDGVQTLPGPLDAHSRLNVNNLSVDDLMLLDSMDESVASSIINWIYGVDETAPAGADESAYTGLRYPYAPRGNSVRSLRELELVQFVDPVLLRGEDANYNDRLDPGEDENADGALTPGWSQYLTAVSENSSEGLSATGITRLDLRTASVEEIASRLRVERNQAQAISDYASDNASTAELAALVGTNLSTLAPPAAPGGAGARFLAPTPTVPNLSDDQLRLLLDEATVGEQSRIGPRRGRVNINTARRETLERLAEIEPQLLDAILAQRDSRADGFTSLVDLLAVEGMSRQRLAELMPLIDVRSSVFIVTSRGVDRATGLSVEITAVLDRSSIPVVIKDLIVR